MTWRAVLACLLVTLAATPTIADAGALKHTSDAVPGHPSMPTAVGSKAISGRRRATWPAARFRVSRRS